MAKKQPTPQAQENPLAVAKQSSEGELLALILEAFNRIEAGQVKVIAQNGAIAEHIAFILAEMRDTKKAKRGAKKAKRDAKRKAKQRRRWARRFRKQ